jgi:hypothetical protein
VFFQISTRADDFGGLIGHDLHLTIRPEVWWRNLFLAMGYEVAYAAHDAEACQLLVSNPAPSQKGT